MTTKAYTCAECGKAMDKHKVYETGLGYFCSDAHWVKAKRRSQKKGCKR